MIYDDIIKSVLFPCCALIKVSCFCYYFRMGIFSKTFRLFGGYFKETFRLACIISNITIFYYLSKKRKLPLDLLITCLNRLYRAPYNTGLMHSNMYSYV